MEDLDARTHVKDGTDRFAKSRHRQALRQLTFPEKVKRVIELQRIAAPILRSRGQHVRVWPDS
jgi:hypothetical protein